MRGLISAVSLILGLALAGEAAAAAEGLGEFAGRWREPGGACDSPYLYAVERSTGSEGETTLRAVIIEDGAIVRGDIVLDGWSKGRLVWDKTGKAVLRLIPLRDNRLKVSVSDGATGLSTTTLDYCAGSRPDYDAADKLRTDLVGAWYEVAMTGRELAGKRGQAACAAADAADGRLRGDLAFMEAGGALNSSGADKKGAHSGWRPTSAHADPFIGGTWLKVEMGADGQTRYLSLKPAEGADQARLIVADPVSKTFRHYHACPA